MNRYDELFGAPPSDDDQEPRQLRCKHCGDTEARWRQQTGRWVLFSMQPGVEHKCPTDSDFQPAPKD